MGYWHEVKRSDNGWLFPVKKGARVAVSFRGEDVRVAPFQGHFLRFEGEGEVPGQSLSPWNRSPEGWFELWPLQPMFASSRDEAISLFEPLLPQLEDGSIDGLFEKRPYQPPARPAFIKDINHPDYIAAARIVKHGNGIYEVAYVVYAPDGKYFPVSTPSVSEDPDFEWGITYMRDEAGRRLQTMADDLASAEEIAATELDTLVTQDPEIKRR